MDFHDIDIVYEDNHLLVVVKPAGVPSQADEEGDDDMVTLLKRYREENEGKKGEAYIGLVHRLDRPTGGVMVFAKTSKAAARSTSTSCSTPPTSLAYPLSQDLPNARPWAMSLYSSGHRAR